MLFATTLGMSVDWRQGCCGSWAVGTGILVQNCSNYNLENLWRRLVLPKRIHHWSLTGLQQRWALMITLRPPRG